MSATVSPTPAAAGPLSSPVTAPGGRKAAVMFAVLTLGLALILVFAAQSGDTTFRLATGSDFVQIPAITVPSTVTAWVLVVVCGLLSAAAFALHARGRRTPLWLVVIFAVAWLSGFLTWAAAGATIPVVGLLGGAIALAVPLVFGALGGVLGERAGVVNIAIDGQLLAGAFAAALVASLTGMTWAGLAGAMLAGTLVALILGLFAISYYVEQVIVGVVLNVLVIGVTSFLFTQVLASDPERFNSPPPFDRDRDPGAGRPAAASARSSSARPPSSTCSTSRCRWWPGRCTAPRGGCGSAPSASTRRPRTPSGSRSTAPATARS